MNVAAHSSTTKHEHVSDVSEEKLPHFSGRESMQIKGNTALTGNERDPLAVRSTTAMKKLMSLDPPGSESVPLAPVLGEESDSLPTAITTLAAAKSLKPSDNKHMRSELASTLVTGFKVPLAAVPTTLAEMTKSKPLEDEYMQSENASTVTKPGVSATTTKVVPTIATNALGTSGMATEVSGLILGTPLATSSSLAEMRVKFLPEAGMRNEVAGSKMVSKTLPASTLGLAQPTAEVHFETTENTRVPKRGPYTVWRMGDVTTSNPICATSEDIKKVRAPTTATAMTTLPVQENKVWRQENTSMSGTRGVTGEEVKKVGNPETSTPATTRSTIPAAESAVRKQEEASMSGAKGITFEKIKDSWGLATPNATATICTVPVTEHSAG